MSSKELSERASVTASYISQVENGIITPSIDTLRNIAKALEVPVFHFFLDEDNFNKVVSSSDREIVEFPNVDLKYEIISSNLKNKIGVMIGKLGVNSQTTKELRSHAGEECILVIQGELQVETLSNKIILKKDDSIHFDSCIPHRFVNTGSETCEFYLILSPPSF